MKEELIAPCGMNCAICRAYLRDKNKCPGCRLIDRNKSKTRTKCIIRNCDLLKKNKSGFCYDCENLPCTRLKQLDKRYRTKYDMSMLENLEFIKKKGIRKFIIKEEKRWKCPNGVICVHDKKCYEVNK